MTTDHPKPPSVHSRLLTAKRLRRSALVLILIASAIAGGREQQAASGKLSLPAERPPMFVLQVGIGKYVKAEELRGAVTDVVEMRKVLEERFRVPAANIKTLKDQEGTKAIIFSQYRDHLIAKTREYFERTKKRDAVALFQFSGHGSQTPDVNGDEKDDGKDETLVTYDSVDVEGKNFDITDDEIYALTGELSRYTDNIVYILDSCHSGSGTRDASEPTRRVAARKTVPEGVAGVASISRSGDTASDDRSAAGMLPPGDDYIVITAARPDEFAGQIDCFEECGSSSTPVVYGNLTFYLIDELKNARDDTSYRELMENVARRVSGQKPTQNPQIEGRSELFVFGSLASSEDNFTRIVQGEDVVASGRRIIRIKAGAMQGVSAGTIVAIYDKADTRFVNAEKVASGTVTSVTPAESTVQLLNPRRVITAADKAVIVAPDLGSLRLKANLDVDLAKLNTTEAKVMSMVRSSLAPKAPQTKDPRGVDLAILRSGQPGALRWDVAVLKDKFSNVAAKMAAGSVKTVQCENAAVESKTDTDAALSPEREVFYLAGKDFIPLYRFCMENNFPDERSQARAAGRLEEALVHLASLKTVHAISNNRSSLKSQVVIKPVRLTGPFDCVDGVLKFGQKEPVAADAKTGWYDLTTGDVFWFEVANDSPKDLYITVLNLGPKGDVKLVSPRSIYGETEGVMIPKGGRRVVGGEDCRGAFQASPPAGMDKFKFILTADQTKRSDFEYLEMPSLTRSSKTSLSAMSDWTTIETFLQISDTKN